MAILEESLPYDPPFSLNTYVLFVLAYVLESVEPGEGDFARQKGEPVVLQQGLILLECLYHSRGISALNIFVDYSYILAYFDTTISDPRLPSLRPGSLECSYTLWLCIFRDCVRACVCVCVYISIPFFGTSSYLLVILFIFTYYLFL
jgi:hypothetical protein